MQTAQRSPAVGSARRGSSPFRLRAVRHASPLSRPAFALDLDEDELLHAPGDRDARIRALHEGLERSVFGQPVAVVSPPNGGDGGNGGSVPLHVTIRARSNSISSALTDVDFSSQHHDQEPKEIEPDRAVQQPNSPCPSPRTASKSAEICVSKANDPPPKNVGSVPKHNAMLASESGSEKTPPTKAHASKYDAMRTAKRGSKCNAMPALQKAKHFHLPTAQQDLPSNAAQQKLADAKRTKQEFCQFIKVLARYLKKHDPAMYKKAMAAIKDCNEKHKAGDPRFASLTTSCRVRLRKVVGRSRWLKANYYFGRSQETGGKENREARENRRMQGPNAASATPIARSANALRPSHLGKRKAPPETADVAAPESKRMKEEGKVRKAHLKWESDADVAPLAMLTDKVNNLEDGLEEDIRLRIKILSQITAGTKIEVYWPRYAKHFPGTVTACHRTLDQFGERHELFSTIHYDDGHIETVDLQRITFRIVSGENVVGHVVARNGLKEPVDGAFPTQKSAVPSAPTLPAAAPPTTTVSITQRRNEILSRITVGMWIAIYWPLDDKFYPGIVASDSQYTGGNHLYTILYDDGQQEKLDLSQETFHILDV